jgi:hypothetical protein
LSFPLRPPWPWPWPAGAAPRRSSPPPRRRGGGVGWLRERDGSRGVSAPPHV